MIHKNTPENENIEDGRKTNVFEMNPVLKIVSASASISALILISLAIASQNGITYYEDRISVKILEILLTLLAVIYLFQDLKIAIKESKLLK